MTAPYIITDATDHCVFLCAECGRYLPVTEVVTCSDIRCTWIFVSCPDHGTMCFHVEREDGSTSDFGVGACLQSVWQLNRGSLRELVRGQIKDFKARRLAGAETFVSDWSGETFPAKEACVDHDPTFRHVVLAFFSGRPENPEVELLTKGCDNSSEPVWKDPALAEAFLQHHSKTGLRLVAARENLSEIKKASA